MEAHQRRKAHLRRLLAVFRIFRSMEAHLWPVFIEAHLWQFCQLWKPRSLLEVLWPFLILISHSHFSKSFGLIWCKGRIFLRWTSKGEWKPTFGSPEDSKPVRQEKPTFEAYLCSLEAHLWPAFCQSSGSKPTFAPSFSYNC